MKSPTALRGNFSLLLFLAFSLWTAILFAADPLPSTWLPTSGKNTYWVSQTASTRTYLTQMNALVSDPFVAPYLPRVKERCDWLVKTDNLNLIGTESIKFLDGMLQDLLKSTNGTHVVPMARYSDKKIAYTYWMEATKMIEVLELYIPKDYDPSRSYMMMMYHKSNGGILQKQTNGVHYLHLKEGLPPMSVLQMTNDIFHCWSTMNYQVKGRLGAYHELEELPAQLAKDFRGFNVDRVFVGGWSDGGFTSVWLGSMHPHLLTGIVPLMANWQYGNSQHIGLWNVPTFVIQGGDSFRGKNTLRMAALNNMGYSFAGAYTNCGHQVEGWENPVMCKAAWDWARPLVRNRYPREVRYSTWNLEYHQAYWFSIERMIDNRISCQIQAKIHETEVNRIDVTSVNTAAYKITLKDHPLIVPGQPVSIYTNGQLSYNGTYADEITINVVSVPAGLVKSPNSFGDITAAIDFDKYAPDDNCNSPANASRSLGAPWLFVIPTGLTTGVNGEKPYWSPHFPASGKVDDVNVTPALAASNNLYLIGGPHINKYLNSIKSQIPVTIGSNWFQIGSRLYNQPQECLEFVYPNPNVPNRYIIVYHVNNIREAKKHDFFGMINGKFGENPYGFRSGDCIAFGVPPATRWGTIFLSTSVGYPEHYVFATDWSLPDQTVLGTAIKTFDYPAIQRLKADAFREFTGADVGLVARYPNSLNRWKSEIPAGPVTLNDIATTHMFPDYIVTADIRGDRLLWAITNYGAAATSVLESREDPAYQTGVSLAISDIQPNQTYRVALDGSSMNCPEFAWTDPDSDSPPYPFIFNGVHEFYQPGRAGFEPVLENMIQTTNSEYTAIAQYISTRGNVAPRGLNFSLTDFYSNPEVNQYGAYDWANIALARTWIVYTNQLPVVRNFKFNIGLKHPGDPTLAPPRVNSQQFLDWNLDQGVGSRQMNLASLNKALPVSVALTNHNFVIYKEGSYYRIAQEGSAVAGLGHATLVNVLVKNEGAELLQGLAGFASTESRLVDGAHSLPGPNEGQQYYSGFIDAIPGAVNHTYDAYYADVRVFTGIASQLRKCVLNGGDSFTGRTGGLVALDESISLNPNETKSLPMLFIKLDRFDAVGPDDQELRKCLADIQPELFNSVIPGSSDVDAPQLGILSPLNKDYVTNSVVQVRCRATDISGMSSVQINGFDAAFNSVEGVWIANVGGIVNGPNTITLRATDASPFHNTSTSSIQITGALDYTFDTNRDGIPELWAIENFGFEFFDKIIAKADNDADGDGLTNLQEYQGGTRGWVPELDLIVARQDTKNVLNWNAAANWVYTAQWSTNFIQWRSLGVGVRTWSNVVLQIEDTPTAATTRKFYRIAVSEPK